MDPSSQAEIELGTISHPYKLASDPFKEILNEFRGTPEQLTVLFRENTVTYITEKIIILNLENLVVS